MNSINEKRYLIQDLFTEKACADFPISMRSLRLRGLIYTLFTNDL
jgi:hypothetical protein